MTWKPTDEMVKAFDDLRFIDEARYLPQRITTALIAVQPLIAADARAKALEEAADVAYLACLKAGKAPRRTKTLGLGRGTYNTEYAAEAKAAIRSLIPKPEGT